MLEQPNLLCLPGSTRRNSGNAALLRAFSKANADLVQTHVYERLGDLPIFNPDLEGAATPAIVTELKTLVGRADGLVIACPEYAHGIPGGFKNLLDWLVSGEELPDKPVMLLHANGHDRGEFLRAALTEVLRTVGVRLVETDGASIYLVSHSLEEAESILALPDNQTLLRDAGARFVAALNG